MKKKLHPAHPLRAGQGTSSAGKAPATSGSGFAVAAGKALRLRAGSEDGSATAMGSISLGGVVALVGIFVWSYWPTMAGLWSTWQRNADYSGGKIVPLIAAYLVWADRKALAQIPVRTCWWGLGVLLFAQVLRLGAVLFSYGSFEQYSLVLTIAGIVLFVLGFPIAWRLKWVLAFLLLMVPLPRVIHGAIALPLQNLATSSAVFGLELLGILVTREGNVLRLGDRTTVAVAEACSGLRMMTAFVVVAVVLAFLVHRPVWQKVVLVASSIPVAIGSNTLRLIITAILYEQTSSEVAEKFFHDFAGLTMMPIAVAASVGLLYLMRWMSSEEPRARLAGA